MFKKTVFALLSAAFALSAHAQEDELSLQLNGFVDSYHALQVEHPHKIMSSRTRLRLEMRANYGEASLFSSVNLAYSRTTASSKTSRERSFVKRISTTPANILKSRRVVKLSRGALPMGYALRT